MPNLRKVLIDLIADQSVDLFYVGNNGAFDRMVHFVLRELVQEYPQIHYVIVLERMSGVQNEIAAHTMLPEGIEEVPPRFAITWRNKWMLRKSNYVVTYITHTWGGAAQFAEIAARQNKIVINLAEYDSAEGCIE